MPCVCGHKVERLESKVQCSKCIEFFHLKCVGIQQADLEYMRSVDKPFFCNVCLDVRRKSFRSPPPPAAVDMSAECQNKNTHGNVITQQSLPTVADELAEIKAVNARLLSAVSALHEENKCLLQKSDSLQAEIRELHTNLVAKDATLSRLLSEIKGLRVVVISCLAQNSNLATDENKQLSSSSSCSLPAGAIASPTTSAHNSDSVTGAGSAKLPPRTANSEINENKREKSYSDTVAGVESDKLPPRSATSAHASSTLSSYVTATGTNIVTAMPTRMIAAIPFSAAVSTSHSLQTSTINLSYAAASAPNPAIFTSSYLPISAAASAALPTTLCSTSTAPVCALIGSPAALSGSALQAIDAFNASGAQTDVVVAGQNDWNTVRHKKGSKQRNIIGRNENVELDVVVRKKWVHVSSFKPTVSEESVISYVSKHSGIDRIHLACHKLVKKDADMNNLRSINFKFGVEPAFYDQVLNPNVWPSEINVRPFRFFQKVGNSEPTK
ncbi:PREDICTED: uncharacterized protein LOC108360932 [Rhagoletis zephyria]|uniref:uncharacterized protein LOC108360932 n=1 Tax=Rhagoletis zephyria TaxID=28612 RepID=UPI0008119036|nr:PREDICTED: uncharacterized protein LOC108360932 [Rhagoletis zephyria]